MGDRIERGYGYDKDKGEKGDILKKGIKEMGEGLGYTGDELNINRVEGGYGSKEDMDMRRDKGGKGDSLRKGIKEIGQGRMRYIGDELNIDRLESGWVEDMKTNGYERA